MRRASVQLIWTSRGVNSGYSFLARQCQYPHFSQSTRITSLLDFQKKKKKKAFDLSGTVVAIRGAVKGLKAGEEVFGCLPLEDMGDSVLFFLRCVCNFETGANL
jgi:hypothetical protein